MFHIDITAAVFTELFVALVYGVVDAERRRRTASSNSARILEQILLHSASDPAYS